jgi:hypothetical protein
MCDCAKLTDYVCEGATTPSWTQMMEIDSDVPNWRELRRCQECGQLWIVEVVGPMDRLPTYRHKIDSTDGWKTRHHSAEEEKRLQNQARKAYFARERLSGA